MHQCVMTTLFFHDISFRCILHGSLNVVPLRPFLFDVQLCQGALIPHNAHLTAPRTQFERLVFGENQTPRAG